MRVLVLSICTALIAAPAASAAPGVSLHDGKAAIVRYERRGVGAFAIGSCRRLGSTRVICHVSYPVTVSDGSSGVVPGLRIAQRRRDGSIEVTMADPA